MDRFHSDSKGTSNDGLEIRSVQGDSILESSVSVCCCRWVGDHLQRVELYKS